MEQLKDYASVGAAMTDLAGRAPEYFATRFASVDGGAVALYHGDAGYDDEDPDRLGARHRLWMVGDAGATSAPLQAEDRALRGAAGHAGRLHHTDDRRPTSRS